jgi:ADP-ribose pyrophosphatase
MTDTARAFERLGVRTVFDGRIMRVTVERFTYGDGTEADREIVRAPGAVAVVAVDDEQLWLVRQPREAVGDPDSLELPAGRLDKDGEQPLETAKRELAEEIGKGARSWELLTTYRSSVGMTDEVVHVFLAEHVFDLDEQPDSGEDERIEIVRWPLADLDRLIASAVDSKTLIGALLLARRRS